MPPPRLEEAVAYVRVLHPLARSEQRGNRWFVFIPDDFVYGGISIQSGESLEDVWTNLARQLGWSAATNT